MTENDAKPIPSEVPKPSFLQSFPDDPRLKPLSDAYLRGDYATIRSGAAKLAGTAAEPEVKAAAEELLRRITPDPMLRWMYLATLVLIVATGLYWMRKT